MSAHLTITGSLPSAPTILGAYEAAAQAAGRTARDGTVAAARSNFPGRGNVRREIVGRVTKTPTGIAVTVAPRKRVEHIARFVESGTGVRGPAGRLIARRGRLPSGAVPSGRGQAAQHPMERTRQQQEAVALRTLEAGAHDAARRLGFGS